MRPKPLLCTTTRHARRRAGPSLDAQILIALLMSPALVLSVGAAGCGVESPLCGHGTVELEGRCVASCGIGTEADPDTGECIAICAPGTHKDVESGGCLPDHARCVSGQVFDHEQGRCVDVAGMCSKNTIWVASEHRCVHESDLRVPDQFEGDGFNSYVGMRSTCEELLLPAQGEVRSFGGRIDEPIYIEDNYAEPDNDCWAFDVDGPTLMRVRIDGLGGASAAFSLVNPFTPWHVDRLGIGTTSSAVERDVFLPEAGTYMLVVSDALNLFNRGPWHGGGDFGYYGEVELLPIPEPIRMDLEDGVGFARGTFPVIPPKDGSSVVFFEASVPRDSLFTYEVRLPNWTVLPAVMAIAPSGKVRYAKYDNMPRHLAFGTEGDVLIAVDMERLAAVDDVPFTLVLQQQELQMIEGDGGSFTVDQPAYSIGSSPPEKFFGFRVEEGEVNNLSVTSSTGRTCFFVWTEIFDVLAGDRGCFISGPPIFEEEMPFEVRDTGLHVVNVQDWAGANIFEDTVISIPAHQYEMSLEIRRQMRFQMGRLESPVVTTETVTTLDWERYFGLTPEVGDIFRFSLEGREELDPFLLSYRLHDLTSSMPIDWLPSDHREFAFRSVNGREQLIGVSDITGAAGSFELRAERFTPPVLGPFGHETKSLDLDHELEADRSRHLFQLEADVPGLLSLHATPLGDLDIAIVPLDASLRAVTQMRLDDGGPGDGESFIHGIPAGPVFLEVVTSDGEGLEKEATLNMLASFEPLTGVEAGNDTPETAQRIELPTTLAGIKNSSSDLHFFTFTLNSAARIDLISGKLGWGFHGAARVVLLDARGVELAMDGGGVGYGRIEDVPLMGGDYYVVVIPHGSTGTQYQLEVRHAN